MLFHRITGYLHRIDKLVEGTVLVVTHADAINPSGHLLVLGCR